MLVLLIAFSLFNVFAAVGALGHGVRLMTREEQEAWRSKFLLFVAAVLSWTFPLAALACTGLAWNQYQNAQMDFIAIILAPLAWLLLLGGVFVAVDYADDGVIGNARRPDVDG